MERNKEVISQYTRLSGSVLNPEQRVKKTEGIILKEKKKKKDPEKSRRKLKGARGVNWSQGSR